MPKPALLQIGDVTDRMRKRLEAEFTITKLFDQSDRAAFLAAQGDSFLAVATDGHYGVPADVMASCPNLKVAASYGVGYDAIDTDACVARGILVSHTPDVLNDEVADTAVMLWLAVSRDLIRADAWVRDGTWERDGNMPLARSIQARQVGILGMGRIGKTIADRVQMFGAKVHYHTRSPKDVPFTYHEDLVSMAQATDVLIVITPGGAATRHLVNAEVLNAIGPEGTLINVSRGSVVDEEALVAALSEKRLGAAGLDVFENEPKVPDALKAMPNVVLTPHIGSATVETRQAMGDLVCDNLSQFLKDGGLVTPIPEVKGLLA